MPLEIPTITTERLILRAPKEDDFDAIRGFVTSDDRMRFLGGPMDRYGAWQNLLANLGHWALRGYGFFAIELKESGECVGRTGVIRHDGWPEPELGWNLFSGHEGSGFAKEAAEAARLYAAEEWGFSNLISHIHPDNGRSISLALRLGAQQESEGTLLGEPVVIFRHPDPREGSDAA